MLRDSWESTLKVKSTANSGAKDTLNVNFVDDTVAANALATPPRYSLKDFAYSNVSARLEDEKVTPLGQCTNDLTKISTDSQNLCTESWAVGTSNTRCVRAKVSFKRKFITPNYAAVAGQKKCDVPFDYRKFEVTAKWVWNGLNIEPGSTTFNS